MPSNGWRALDDARLAARAFGLVDELDLDLARAAQQHLARLGRQLLERRVEVEAVVAGDALEQREGVAVAPVPALDRAAGQAERREGDDALGVEHGRDAEAVAGRAGADRRVEREQARLELGQRVVAERAGELARVEVLGAPLVHLDRERAPVGDAQRRLEALGEALAQRRGGGGVARGGHLDAVDDDVDVVLLGLLQLRHVGGVDGRAVDAEAHVALRLHLLEQLDELALAVAHDRREHHQPRLGRQRERRVDHLADALRLQRRGRGSGSTACRRARTAGAGSRGSR